jgi:hypothetical protein
MQELNSIWMGTPGVGCCLKPFRRSSNRVRNHLHNDWQAAYRLADMSNHCQSNHCQSSGVPHPEESDQVGIRDLGMYDTFHECASIIVLDVPHPALTGKSDLTSESLSKGIRKPITVK